MKIKRLIAVMGFLGASAFGASRVTAKPPVAAPITVQLDAPASVRGAACTDDASCGYPYCCIQGSSLEDEQQCNYCQ